MYGVPIINCIICPIASTAKNKTDADANEDILSALSKRGPEALDVLVEALEAEEDVHKRLIERIRKGWYRHCFSFSYHIIALTQNGLRNLKTSDLQVCFIMHCYITFVILLDGAW